jgi:hypothetical protein
MEQPEIKQLLQQKIFNHPSAKIFNAYSRAVLKQLSNCHTIRLGMHVYACNNCQHVHHQYHSCGNRHCPNCGGLKREQWLQDRLSELLPTSYFHIVFTLPQQLRPLVMGNRKLLFNLLFESSTYTLRQLGNDARFLGAVPGIISILHTNGQDLSFHPHVHCIVSGGGVRKDGVWVKEKRSKGNFLFPRKLLEKTYKNYFLQQLKKLANETKLKVTDPDLFNETLEAISKIEWNVYAKAPFAGPEQIIEYLGRYTHKVAISTNRIKEITDTDIRFAYKDYKDGNKRKEMSLTHAEFLRRFEQHILPRGFVKIRHSGFLSHQNKGERLAAICQQLKIAAPAPKVALPVEVLAAMTYGIDIKKCSVCKVGRIALIGSYVNITNFGVALVNVNDLHNRGSPKKIR